MTERQEKIKALAKFYTEAAGGNKEIIYNDRSTMYGPDLNSDLSLYSIVDTTQKIDMSGFIGSISILVDSKGELYLPTIIKPNSIPLKNYLTAHDLSEKCPIPDGFIISINSQKDWFNSIGYCKMNWQSINSYKIIGVAEGWEL